MTYFHAVFTDETGCEFGAGCEAATKEEARAKLREDFPESRIVQLEGPEDTREREQAMYDHIARGGDWDEEGRPIGGYYDDDYDDDDDEDEEDEDDLEDQSQFAAPRWENGYTP